MTIWKACGRSGIHRQFNGAILAFTLVVALLYSASPAAARYSAIVIDADTGQVLHERSASVRRYPASLTKVMTLYMVFDALDRGKLRLSQSLPVSRRAAGQAPSKLGLKRGQRILVRDAILALVTKSANDAATVLAEAVGGTEAKFARMMTKRAWALGMKRTSFRNASGLPNRRQKSTARDMGILARALMRDHPNYYRFFATRSFKWGKRRHRNHNTLLSSYAGADGIKTGYIRASGFNLIASAKRDGRRLIGVVFGARSPRSRDAKMRHLLDDGFRQLGKLRVARRDYRLRGRTGVPIPKRKPIVVQVEGLAPAPNKQTAEFGADQWGVQVGIFRTPSGAKRRAGQATKVAPSYLKRENILVVPYQQGRRELYRARVLGLSEVEARKVCRVLKRKKFRCAPVAPSSSRLAALN